MAQKPDDRTTDLVNYLIKSATQMLDGQCRNRGRVDDAVADSVSKLIELQDSGRAPSLITDSRARLLKWVYLTARNLLRNADRTFCRRAKLRMNHYRHLGVVAADDTSTANDGVSVKLLYSTDWGFANEEQLAAAVQAAIAELSQKEQRVASLLIWYRVGQADIARQTGLLPTTIQSIVRRIHKNLPAILERHGIPALALLGRKKGARAASDTNQQPRLPLECERLSTDQDFTGGE